jgi:hypothetical protein
MGTGRFEKTVRYDKYRNLFQLEKIVKEKFENCFNPHSYNRFLNRENASIS